MASSGDMTEEEVKKYIKGIITSNPLVSTIQTVQKDYRDLIGTSIPYYKFKYNSVEHFLKSIPDTCVVQGTGSFAQVTPVLSAKSAHINKMVTQQKVNTKGRRKPMAPRRSSRSMGYCLANPNRPPPRRRPPPNNYAISSNSSSNSSIGYVTAPTQSIPTNNDSTKTTGASWNSNAPSKNIDQNKNTNTVGNMNREGANVNRLGHRTENTEEERNYRVEQNKLESNRVKKQLDNLIKQQVELGNVATRPDTSTPRPYDADSLNRTDSSNIPENAPMLDTNTSKYLNISSNEISNGYTKNTSELYEDNLLNRSKERLKNLLIESRDDDDLDDEDTSNVPRRVQDNLRKLISQFNDGIWCSDVPTQYRKLFNKELMYMEYGYTSLIEMCISLKHIFHYVRPGKDDFKLYDRSKPLPESVEKLYTIASFDKGEKAKPSQALPQLEWSDFRGHVPDDIFKYGNEIPNQFLPEGTKVENILDVVVVEIYDPSKFWFYLGTSEYAALDELMDDLQNFYNVPENANDYAIPRGALREGLYCVQVIYGEYHRARIVRVLPDNPDYVRVLYIDYGTVCKAPIKGLCFLHSRFALLNAQAVRCRLANICPTLKGHPWPRSACDRFRDLVNRRDTKIKISYIDWNEEYVCVFLADVTEKDNAIYINEVLVKEGHARWDNETPTVPFVLSNFKCKVQNIHLFPTFLELEYGLAPNSGEMYSLEDTLVPLQFCIPQYFEPDDQIITSEDENDIEQIENAFVETVRNHRKFTQFNQVDISAVSKPPPIDFNLFGDLKDEMIEFCKTMEVEEGVQDNEGELKQEEQLICEAEDLGANTKDFSDIERSSQTSEWLRVSKEDKDISENIIEKLRKYSMSGLENSNSESSAMSSAERDNLDIFSKSDSKQFWSAEEAIDDLSTIMEQSEMDVTGSEPGSPKNKFLGFLNITPSRSDVNIFDNPEEFESSSDKSDSDRPVSPESFLKTIERITNKDLEEENMLEESTSSTGNSASVSTSSDNPFKFDINADLKEAFKKYLESKKPGNDREPSFLKCDVAGEEIVIRGGGGDTDVSFLRLKSWKKLRDNEKDHIEEEEGGVEDNLNLEDTTGSFLSTVGLNNPFRKYLHTKKKKVVHISSESSEEDNVEKTTPDKLESEQNTRTGPLEDSSMLKDDVDLTTLYMQTSDTESSDYATFVPGNSKHKVESLSKEESLGLWVQSTVNRKDEGVSSSSPVTPAEVEIPPRDFGPTAFVPMGYPSYPRWSNEAGFPVPQYPQWSTGAGYPGPCYPRPRESMAPPPGFGYQCPPQLYHPAMNPYMAPRMMPPAPLHPGYAPYYAHSRPVVPSRQPEEDFYDRYNQQILSGLRKS